MTLRRRMHKLWQCLPQPWRRQFLFRATSLLAPCPDQPPPRPPPDAPVIIAGFLTAATGLGEWARLAVRAFTAAGCDVRGIDLGAAMMQGNDLAFDGWRDGRDVYGPGTLLLHVNGPYVPMAMKLLGGKLVRGKRVIGCWAWELPELPADWDWGFGFVHEIWGLSDFTAAAIHRRTRLPVKSAPLPVLPPETLPPHAQRAWRKPPGTFAVLMMFNMASGFTRKNPLGAIAAFKTAFGDDQNCKLLIKIVNPNAYPAGLQTLQEAAGPNIELLTATLPAVQNAALIAECDAVISLHRAEGFALVPAEAMAQGKPAIATGWSGNLAFMTPDNSCLVPYRLVPAHDPQATYDRHAQSWAEPDIAAAAAMLRQLRDDPAYALALGERARRDIAEKLSLAAYAHHLD